MWGLCEWDFRIYPTNLASSSGSMAAAFHNKCGLFWFEGYHRAVVKVKIPQSSLFSLKSCLFFFPWINSPYIAASFLLISRSEKADWQYLSVLLLLLWRRKFSDILILPLLLTCIKGSFLIVIFLLHLLAGILYRTFPHQLFSYHLILVGKNDRINAWQESLLVKFQRFCWEIIFRDHNQCLDVLPATEMSLLLGFFNGQIHEVVIF